MLSRVAENLYWIGRSVERAENTARLLEVNYYATLEATDLVSEQWGPLLSITGSQHDFPGKPDGRTVPHWLAFDTANRGSIRSSLTQARENARSLRDRISSEMWECVNRAYLALCFETESVLERDGLHAYCEAARETSHLFFGIAEATLLRDQGWHFLQAGRLLERGDNLLRLMGVRYGGGGEAEVAQAVENHRWMAVLKSVSAYEAYRKAYQTRLDPRRIAEFLLLAPEFPRSVRHSAEALREHLEAIAACNPGSRRDALREVGWLAARLEYSRVEGILDALDPSLEQLLSDFSAVGSAIHGAYFRPG